MRFQISRVVVIGLALLALVACGGGGGGGHETPVTAASITIVSGNNQTGVAGSALPTALGVSVKDSSGRAFAGASVRWAVVAGGGSVMPASSTTDGAGLAATNWTLGAAAGANRATATVAGVASAAFDATAIAVPVVLTSIAVTGVPSVPMMPGNSAQLSAIATYSDQSTKVVTTEVAWSVTDTTVLTVTATGKLAANEPGKTVVIAALSGISGSANVEVVPLQVSAYELRLTGDPQVMIGVDQYGLHCVPDEHVSFRRTDTEVDMWLVASDAFTQFGGGTVRLQGTSFETLFPNPGREGKAVPVFLPSGSGFDKDYAGAASVLTAANGKDLLMIYHAEAHNCGGLDTLPTVGIGLARSSDGGFTWTRQGQVISSSAPQAPCPIDRFYGAGNPVAVMTRERDYYYIYFLEFDPNAPPGIYLARSPVSADAAPGSWKKYYRGSFSEPGLGGRGDPVIGPPSPAEVTRYVAMPSVSFNLFLQRYVAVVSTATTFYYTASEDGIHWEPGRDLGLGGSASPGYPAGNWIGYPSLLSLDQPSDGTTTGSGYLYYAHGTEGACHFMERRAFQILR
jgi:hypothetical protein